ncbi:MAG: glycosyltransferase family 39 protein, partial [Ilumatobacter sp.]|nr:glycosyltransferase family 39 protein [Ilumatobacter sp.]
LVYATLVRRWGRIAATVGALALAVTPISVMVNHSNNTDAILTLMMTATVFAGVRAAETGRWGWMVATGLLFGAAFTSKMLAAAPVLPAVLLAVAVVAPLAWRRRTALLAGGTAIAVVAGLAWFTFVDLTPASQRPYVGSSATNSAFQLAFERNGVNQVEGDSGVGPGAGGADSLPDRPQQDLPPQDLPGLPPAQGLPDQGL